MKEYIKNNKNLIISHIADVDGISSVILAKVHYGDIDYYLVEIAELEDALKKVVYEKQYEKYDNIFITDLSFRPSSIKIVEDNVELKNKIKHFDHHATELGNAKKYSYINVVNDKDGVLECGTTLFYDYIKDDFKYKSDFLNKYLEAVRQYDTLGPLGSSRFANNLTTLFSIIGIDAYIDKFCNGIKKRELPITVDDMNLVSEEDDRRKEYIDLCDKNLVRINLNGYNVGFSISELYRSSVGNELSLKYKDELDYILIANFVRGQYSFRTVKDDVHVGEIAKSFTKEGGGHPKAAGMPINKDTLFILDLVKEAMLKKEEKQLSRKLQNN